jgi:hypothetical protein
MAFQLATEEPEGRPWHAKPLTTVIEALVQLGADRTKSRRGVVLAVDGRSSSGKTSLAARLHGAIAKSAVVHTDDLAWSHSRFGWSDLLIDGVLVPFSRGELVRFRPPRWAEHRRPGSIEVAATCAVLIIEGVGAGRAEAGPLLDGLVWVQADRQEAEQRSLARLGQPGGPRTVGDYRDWMAEEEPFLAHQRPWERADMLVAGTPHISFDPVEEIVVAPPLAQKRDTSARQ